MTTATADLSWLDELPDEALRALYYDAQRLIRETSLLDYRPYPKQKEFHAAGARYRERLLMAGNQVGKTWAGGAEYAMHLTQRYPDWWSGRVWHRPIVGWVAGRTGELTRDGPQRVLMGRPTAIGTGSIPRDAIIDYSMKRGVADAIDTVIVRHGGGGDVQAGQSVVTFKSYDQGASKFAAETLDLVWYDEEPDDLAIYTEGLTRTNTTKGMVYMTFTPLFGMSDVVARFLLQPSPDRIVITMTLDDAEHYTPEERARIIASYPEHERSARVSGVPMMGSGRVFPVEEQAIRYASFALPEHWPRIAGIDFGYDHPTAVAWLAWDRDTDTVYVYDCYRVSHAAVPVHASAIRARGAWIPVAWPQDGLNDTAQGPQLAQQYRAEGVNMRPTFAQFAETSDDRRTDTRQSRVSVEAGISEMLTRMMEGRLKVAEHLADWWEEFRLYHRKDGRIVKERDDLLCATRYALMDLRYALAKPRPVKLDHARPINWRVP